MFDYAVPAERIRQSRIGGSPERFVAVISAGFEGIDGAAVFVVANGPQQHDGDESEPGGEPPSRPALVDADFLVDQREKRWRDQSEQQASEHDGLEDEDDVP